MLHYAAMHLLDYNRVMDRVNLHKATSGTGNAGWTTPPPFFTPPVVAGGVFTHTHLNACNKTEDDTLIPYDSFTFSVTLFACICSCFGTFRPISLLFLRFLREKKHIEYISFITLGMPH